MSNEERLRLRKQAQSEDTKETAVEDGTVSKVSISSASAAREEVQARTRTNSTVTAATDRDEVNEVAEENAMKDAEDIDEREAYVEDAHETPSPSTEQRHSFYHEALEA